MSTSNGNKVVHGLWIGNSLSNLELLTINSFIYHGHEFHLWLYDEIETPLSDSVILEDANKIIPSNKIFRYEYSNQFGHGKGSVAGFSDIFRYKLLYERGGWWVDMDVTCLRPFDFIEPYVFREHSDLAIVGNVMKCPIKSELMKNCYEEAIVSVNAKEQNWLKPIVILNQHVKKLKLENYIIRDMSFPDHFMLIQLFRNFLFDISSNIYFIHWLNEELRHKKRDKNKFRISSNYGSLLIKYGVIKNEYSKFDKVKNRVRTFNPMIKIYKFVLFRPKLYFTIRCLKMFVKKYLLFKVDEPERNGLSPAYLKKLELILK